MITQAIVKRLFDYDPLTGVLIRRSNRVAVHPLQVRVDGRMRRTSNIIWLWMTGSLPVNEIDHKNTNESNNSWSNLRAATRNDNAANRNAFRPNKLKWAYLRKTGKYEAALHSQGRWHYLGIYDTEQEAHDVAYAHAQKLYGAFVRR